MLKGIVLAIGAFALFLPLHVVVLRVLRPRARFRSMLALHAVLAVAILVAYAAPPANLPGAARGWGSGGAVLGAVNALVVHWFLFMGYSMLYFLIDRGFSVRILVEVERARGCALGLDDIAAVYPPADVVRRRLEDMVQIGRLTRAGEGYRLTRRGCWDARMFAGVKAFLQLGPGG